VWQASVGSSKTECLISMQNTIDWKKNNMCIEKDKYPPEASPRYLGVGRPRHDQRHVIDMADRQLNGCRE